MAARSVNVDYDTLLILPSNLRGLVPGENLAHFVLNAIRTFRRANQALVRTQQKFQCGCMTFAAHSCE